MHQYKQSACPKTAHENLNRPTHSPVLVQCIKNLLPSLRVTEKLATRERPTNLVMALFFQCGMGLAEHEQH
jgi:hypothetical protein